MTTGDVAPLTLLIGAIGTTVVAIITAVGAIFIQLKTLKISQQTSAKVDANTEVTEAAKAAATEASTAAIQASKGLTGVITRVEESKALSAANASTIAKVIAKVEEAKEISAAVAAKVGDVVAQVVTVADKISAVRTATDGLTTKLAEAKLAQGLAEGHVAGVAAEQQRIAGMTQQMRALEIPEAVP